ncbi:Fc.00g000260.m01.CDS01 [Cosmosporella sp. VM-42]
MLLSSASPAPIAARGSTGQFVSSHDPEGTTQTPRPEQEPNIEVSTAQSISSKDFPTRTAREPEFSLNLERFHDSDASPIVTEVSGRERDTASTRTAPSSGGIPNHNQNRSESRPAFIGESWFASFLTHNATARHTDIHQPVEVTRSNRTSRAPSPNHQSEIQSAAPTTKDSPLIFPALPPQYLRQRLIDSYFSLFHAYCPILDKSSFISSVEDGSVSPTLLRCVLFVATTQCDASIFYLLGYSTRMDFGDEFFARAKSAFKSDNTSDRIAMLQSSYLLHCWWGQPTAFKDSLWWLSSAIRSAQCMGMNRSTRRSRMPKIVQALWKRIWWCLYIRDRQISFAIGVPMIINELDCDVEDPTPEDFSDESAETAYYIIGQASLNRTASILFFRHCSPAQIHLSAEPSARHYAQQDIQTTLRKCHDELPGLRQKERRYYLSLTLDMCHNLYLIHHHQRVGGPTYKSDIRPEDLQFILDAADNITRLVEDAMIYWSPEYLPMMWYSAINHDYSTPNSSTSSHYDQFRMMTEPQLIDEERSQANSYLLDDWSGIFALDGYDAHADLPFLGPWNIGLQPFNMPF